MQEGQDQDFDNDSVAQPEFSSDDIGSRATTEYFSNVEGGKKNKEKVANKRTRFTRKTLFVILGAIVALAIIFIGVFTILNLRNRIIGKRTEEEIPTTMTEVRRRAYKVAYDSGKYYDGIVYLKNLILDMRDSDVDANFIFETEVFLARLINEAGAPEIAIDFLQSLERREVLTDGQKYWLYGAFIDIYRSQDNAEKMQQYSELFKRLDANNKNLNLSESLGGSANE